MAVVGVNTVRLRVQFNNAKLEGEGSVTTGPNKAVSMSMDEDGVVEAVAHYVVVQLDSAGRLEGDGYRCELPGGEYLVCEDGLFQRVDA